MTTTTLTRALGTGERQVYLASLTGIQPNGLLAIDNELVRVTALATAGSVVVSRGEAGTAAAQHANSSTVSIGNPIDFTMAMSGQRIVSGPFAAFPTAPLAGDLAFVTDSTVNTWGTTVAGGGTNKVLAVFNGSNWTVLGK